MNETKSIWKIIRGTRERKRKKEFIINNSNQKINGGKNWKK